MNFFHRDARACLLLYKYESIINEHPEERIDIHDRKDYISHFFICMFLICSTFSIPVSFSCFLMI